MTSSKHSRPDGKTPRWEDSLHERAAICTLAFDAVLTVVGVRIIKAPVRATQANASAERWIASARRECLDRMLIR